jgi:hypothetical protein
MQSEIHPLSCGCVEIQTRNKYNCYIHPKCKLDAGKTTRIEGYNYKPWYELPKELQEKYKHNIFTGEF